MRLEGEHGTRRVRAAGMGGTQQMRVAEMHAIEIAQRHGGAAGLRGDGAPVLDDVHRRGLSGRRFGKAR